ncbi:hypothetical protein [Nocardia brasiliensis]|uniref:hypothetical protein n=1 Tax=Nocardia brasiliensis TaxID=37326 RepID=UPI003D8DEEC7
MISIRNTAGQLNAEHSSEGGGGEAWAGAAATNVDAMIAPATPESSNFRIGVPSFYGLTCGAEDAVPAGGVPYESLFK